MYLADLERIMGDIQKLSSRTLGIENKISLFSNTYSDINMEENVIAEILDRGFYSFNLILYRVSQKYWDL